MKNINPIYIDTEEAVNEPDFVLKGLPRRSVGMLISEPQVDKGLFALQEAIKLHLGLESPFAEVAKSRNVGFVSLDHALPILKQRIAVLSEQFDVDNNPETNFLVSCEKVSRSLEKMKEANLDLLVIDSFARFHSLNENYTQDMMRVMTQLEDIAKDLNCAVLILGASTKGTKSSPKGVRGSSAINDCVKVLWLLEEVEGEEVAPTKSGLSKYAKPQWDHYPTHELRLLEANYTSSGDRAVLSKKGNSFLNCNCSLLNKKRGSLLK